MTSAITAHPFDGRPSDGRLTLRLLGDPYLARVGDTGDEVRLLGKGKPLALIAYLSVIPQHEASRDFLMDLLWGGNCVRDPAHSLRNVLLQIKNAGLDDLLDANMTRCRLAQPLPTDLAALTAALEEHRTADAVALFTGEFFADFAAPGCHEFELWADGVRHRVRSDVANALDVQVRRLLDSGRCKDAAGAARRLIEIEPHGQRSRRSLIEALLASGEHVHALTETAVLERWLSTEELDPEPATRALIAQVRRGPPSPGARPDEATTELRADLIGREHEFAAIISAWDEAKAGRTGFVTITAGAGVGKSRLLADVEQRLRSSRARTVSLRALPSERDLPFAFASVLVAKLAQLGGAAAVSPATAGVLLGLNASLADIFSAPADTAGHDLVLRRAQALHELLTAVADERPLALLLDDLHWADDASVDVILSACARLTSARLLVVGAERPGGRLALPAERTLAFVLSPLNDAEVAALLGSIKPLPDAPWRADAVAAIHAATHGVPLFVLMALRDAVQAGHLRTGETTWECDDPPTLIQHLVDGNALSHTLATLPTSSFRLTAILAIAGRALPTRVLAALADGLEEPHFKEALEEAERRALIVRDGDRYAVAHDLVAETILALLHDPQRVQWSRELALAWLHGSDGRWVMRGVRLLAGVTTPAELARILGPVLERVPLARNVSVRATLRDWLGAGEEAEATARAVARRLPARIRLRPFRRRMLVTLATVGFASAVVAWQRTRPPTRPDAVLRLFVRVDAAHVAAWSAPIRSADWDPSEPLTLRRGPAFTDSSLHMRAGTGASIDPRGGRFLEERVFDDSGASDVVAVTGDGVTERLTRSSGDDVPGSWSPDAQSVAFATSRWSELRHHAIAMLDVRTGAVRRVSRGVDRERLPQWSPDGSRLAFVRSPLDGRPTEVCIVDVDGHDERCTALAREEAPDLLGWSNPKSLVVSLGRVERDPVIVAVAPDSAWRRDTLVVGAWETSLAPSGTWMAWRANAAADGSYRVAPLNSPDRARLVAVPDGATVEGRPSWGGTGSARAYVDSLYFRRRVDTIYVGVPHRIETLAVWSDGRRSRAPHVDWTSDDPRVSVDSTTEILASTPGAWTLRVSAGGWRRTTHQIVVLPAVARVAVDERWTTLSRWRPFGEPSPRVVHDARLGGALSNEGDGTYFSGAYLRQPLSYARGVAVDATVRTPVTELQWQMLDVEFRQFSDSGALARWDHRTGFMPRTDTRPGLGSCGLLYPTSEGIEGRRRLLFVSGDIALDAATQRWMQSGAPYRVRIQVLPDGRCGVAVNGVPLWRSDESFAADTPLFIVTYGNAWRTQMLIGPLQVREGVPADIDWSRVPRRAEVHIPRENTTPRPPQ
ncbi:MAG: AAA family ATPase [Gemmatimonadaceae bacterium]|nr:AAA family ATPase [Gemmatimonadaceae bacterium]